MTANPNTPGPRWRRRKADRPGEIIEAALSIFAERGFAAARLDDIAKAAGVAKGSLYLYFETKEALFRAVVRQAVAPNVQAVQAAARAIDAPFAELAPRLLAMAAALLQASRVPAVVRVVVGESRNFPDLAQIWHDEVVGPVLAGVAAMIARAQARGEVRPGDPRLLAFSLMGPMVMGVLFREVFQDAAADPPDLAALAAAHAETALRGLALPPIHPPEGGVS